MGEQEGRLQNTLPYPIGLWNQDFVKRERKRWLAFVVRLRKCEREREGMCACMCERELSVGICD